MTLLMRVPCAYQGGKQRVASQIVDVLVAAAPSKSSYFYDLCCGSGAISIELVNRGVDPTRIVMLDNGPWGGFWQAIGSGTFNMRRFERILKNLPNDKRAFKAHLMAISSRPVGKNEAELYPVLQACSFGGKQIWRRGGNWVNACFRDYWEPTATSVRRSPANPMQPSPSELHRRIGDLVEGMKGIRCLHADVTKIFDSSIKKNAIIYIDPPYQNTTGYAFNFEITAFVASLRKKTKVPIFVSEGRPLSKCAIRLVLGGPNGGISGLRLKKHEEWLNAF